MKTKEQTPQGEAALLDQISTLQKQLDDCLEPIGKKKTEEETPWARVDRMVERHGSQEAWHAKIKALDASYDPAILKVARELLSWTAVSEYIEVMEDSYRALVMSKQWKELGKEYRDDTSYNHKLLMHFLRKLQIIEVQRKLEREIREI